MIKILVVDDKIEKQGNIAKVINNICAGRDDIEIKTVSYIVDAKDVLSRTTVDIMILDICLPLRVGADLQRDGGIKLLKEINGSVRYTYPRFVIALSEHEELTREFSLEAGIIHTSIYYNLASNEWNIRLGECIKTAISIMANNIVRRSYNYDIAVICALPEEMELVKEGIQDIVEIKITDDDYIFYTGYYLKGEKKIRVVIAQSTQKGMVPAATLTTRLIYNFAPRYIVMTGITAGIRGKVHMGDAVVAEYVWDYGAGKEIIDGEEAIHRNTIEQIAIEPQIANMVRRLSADSTALADIKRQFKGPKPDFDLQLHLGPVATGAAVLANVDKVKNIQNNQIRDVIAVEMEIYGVYYAARWAISPKPHYIAIKSICDFADETKADEYHYYASYVSAKIFEKLAIDYFIYD